MKSLKKQRRIQIVGVGLAAVVALLAIFAFLPEDAFSFFRSPTQVVEAPPPANETFRMGGLVKDGSIANLQGVRFDFVMTDGGAEVPVRYIGDEPRPDLFTEGQGTVITGKLVDGVFQATELLAKHDETYMPAEVIEVLKEQGVYREPTD
ncbi:MAG: cytochrome c maturation protein CcmE [Pseudomonadota bacterium]